MALCFAEKLSSGGTLGNVLALLSGLGFALLPLMWRKQLATAVQNPEPGPGGIPPRYRLHLPEVTLVIGNLITALVALPSLISDPPHSATSWIGVGLLGTVQIGFAYLLYGAAVRRLRAIECLLAATLEPILNPLWVALWAHEKPGRSTLLGGGVILFTVLLHGLYSSRKRA
jgi:drug/metabolite transporter (DMT)-like permease